MGLTVTRSRVKEKCGISDSGYDAAIDNLIAEVVPALEADLDLSTVDMAILNLGATELVCAEFLDQMAREAGVGETVQIGDLHLQPATALSSQLRQQGLDRLSLARVNRAAVRAAGPKVSDE